MVLLRAYANFKENKSAYTGPFGLSSLIFNFTSLAIVSPNSISSYCPNIPSNAAIWCGLLSLATVICGENGFESNSLRIILFSMFPASETSSSPPLSIPAQITLGLAMLGKAPAPFTEKVNCLMPSTPFFQIRRL